MPTIQRLAAAARCSRRPGVQRGRRRDLHPRRLLRLREASRSAPNSPPSSSPRPCPPALESLRPMSRAAARRGRRPKPRSTRLPPKSAGLRLGDDDQARLGRGGSQPTASSALPGSATPRSAAPASPRSLLPVAQRITGKRGEFDQISVAADEGVSAATAETADRARAAALGPGRDRPRKRRTQLRPNPRRPRLPADLRCSSSPSSPSSSAPS